LNKPAIRHQHRFNRGVKCSRFGRSPYEIEVAALNIGCIDGVELTRRAIRLIDKHNQ
jgi:hypothetical protein